MVEYLRVFGHAGDLCFVLVFVQAPPVTFPVEQAISGLPGLDKVRSISKFGLSQVVVTFHDDTEIYFARQLVNERLGTVELPEGIQRPQMGPVSTGLGEVFHYVLGVFT